MDDSTTVTKQKRSYEKPQLERVGTLAELTEGFAGSIPDEQGGQTKQNPFQG
ncbi:lasso RiPP family leader peptide-containing protein [Salinimonas marina]|uniref:Lasso RiPP family leader peptide-containing protein n=1 Tax=Salinimonas marina TaxID=2785918 RepID=A0A7S9DW98_9ALTE|nr:lasso RiPP family leader peptide-containing protein [Salinimonas marina]QPG05142.1 lasso RiPP family leader peptide-containing protein [Salinimonas marina]